MARQVFTFRSGLYVKKISPKKDNPSEKYVMLISSSFDNVVFCDPKKLPVGAKEGDSYEGILTVKDDGNISLIAIVAK
jgi:hypothetical protein